MCPLVTRQVNQGNVFKQATEPAEWTDGDLWIDTDTDILYIRRSGSAVVVGGATQTMTTEGDTLFRNATVPARLAIGTAAQVLAVNSGATAPEWVDPSGAVEILDSHEATGTASTYTYTPGTALDMLDKYSHLIIICQGQITAALALQCVINAQASAYYDDGAYITGGTETLINNDNQAAMELVNSAVSSGTRLACELHLMCADDATTAYIAGLSHAVGASTAKYQSTSHGNTGLDAPTITSIKIQTSTSTWKAGFKITTFGVLRT